MRQHSLGPCLPLPFDALLERDLWDILLQGKSKSRREAAKQGSHGYTRSQQGSTHHALERQNEHVLVLRLARRETDAAVAKGESRDAVLCRWGAVGVEGDLTVYSSSKEHDLSQIVECELKQ